MSDDWKPFWDDLLAEAANTRQKAIGGSVGLFMGPDGSYLAGSKGYALSAKEASAITQNFAKAGDVFGPAGVTARGKKYNYSKSDTEFVLAKQGAKDVLLIVKSQGDNYVVLEFNLDTTKNTAENALFYVGKWVDTNLSEAGY